MVLGPPGVCESMATIFSATARLASSSRTPNTVWSCPSQSAGYFPRYTKKSGPALPPAQPISPRSMIFGPRSVRVLAPTLNDRIVPCTRNPGSTRYRWHDPPEHPRSVASRCTNVTEGKCQSGRSATRIEPAGVTTVTARGPRGSASSHSPTSNPRSPAFASIALLS